MIVTIVTPTLNAVDYLRQCIESIRANEKPGIEVEHVIVDGGSTDGTVELADAYGLRVLKGKDQGIFDAFNKGSDNSAGELLGFVGADDVLLEGALAHVVQAHTESGRRWLVGSVRWIDEQGRSLGDFAPPPDWMTTRMLACLGWNPIMHQGTYISREFYTELGGYNINYRDAGDYEMLARALTAGPFTRMSRPVACFRRTGSNNSAVNRERSRLEAERIRTAFGPEAAWEQQLNRYILKSWFNIANPRWTLTKFAERGQRRLNPRKKWHY